MADQEAAGSLFPQGDVFINGHQDRFDAVLDFGLTILSSPGAPRPSAEAKVRAQETADIVVELTLKADVQGAYGDWFRGHDPQFVIVRPDFYVYGSVSDETGL